MTPTAIMYYTIDETTVTNWRTPPSIKPYANYNGSVMISGYSS